MVVFDPGMLHDTVGYPTTI